MQLPVNGSSLIITFCTYICGSKLHLTSWPSLSNPHKSVLNFRFASYVNFRLKLQLPVELKYFAAFPSQVSKYGNVVHQFDLPFCIFIVCQCSLTAFDYIYFWALVEHNMPSYFGTSEVRVVNAIVYWEHWEKSKWNKNYLFI